MSSLQEDHAQQKEDHLKEANRQLHVMEDRYRQMIDEVQDYAIILLDPEGNILNWNKGAQHIKLYSQQDIIGKHFSVFYLPEDQRIGLPKQLIHIAAAEGRANHEGWRVRKDGTRFWGNITITAVHDSNGEIVGYSKVTRDLTEKKLAEDQLRASTEELKRKNEELIESEERYHHMVAEVQDYAILLLNTKGEIQNWNAGAASIKGYKASEVIGKNFKIFYPAEDLKNNLPDTLLSMAAQKGKAVQEGWRIRKDGSRFWGSIVITALHNREGQVSGFTKVTRDLTEKKEAEDRLLRYTADLEAKNRELEEFAYIASHDLQEPLRKIETFINVIQSNFNDTSVVERYFDKIKISTQRMSALIKSLLNYSRFLRAPSSISAVDLNALIAIIKTDFDLLIEEKQAVVTVGSLPIVRGSAVQLQQLFANLLSNALKFCGAHPEITISSRVVRREEVIDPADVLLNRPNYFEIVFHDNGIGFDTQFKEQIFIMFRRLHGQDKYSGTGIGLALCKKIAIHHGGHLTAMSQPGKGSDFILYLPVE